MKTATNKATESNIIPGVIKTPAHAKLVTKAIARFARIHNEYANTVRQNSTLRCKAVEEWNAAHAKG